MMKSAGFVFSAKRTFQVSQRKNNTMGNKKEKKKKTPKTIRHKNRKTQKNKKITK